MLRRKGMRAKSVLFWGALICVSVPAVLCGFACLSNPCFNGICIDDVNSTYSCYCIDGYTGILCQTNWDECYSNPCANGATCVDGIATFNCTCSSGFYGDQCELNINECESNPCYNNGTCIDGVDGYRCHCLPGFDGSYCEEDISVCNKTEETRCENGGICVEGFGDEFKCICQPGWTGTLCEEEIDECTSSPCKNGAVCIDLFANYTCACSFGFTGRDCEVELEMCGENDPCENRALCLIESRISVCYCVPDFHGDRCQSQYDECLLGPGCKNGGFCIDGVDGYTCSCPPHLAGDFCECLIFNESDMNCSYVAPSTPFFVPTQVPTTLETLTPEPQITESSTTLIITDKTTTLMLSSEISTAFQTSFEPTEGSTETTYETTSKTMPFSTSTEAITTEFVAVTNVSIPSITDNPTELFTTTSITTNIDLMPNNTVPQVDTTFWSILDSTTEFLFPTDKSEVSSTELPTVCTRFSCLNGGMCLNATTGLQCVCKAGWEGMFCEEKHALEVAAFSGMSYVSHRLRNISHMRVDITARTVAITGMILYSQLSSGAYMVLYLEDGLLKFKFSCGLQTMLLSEVQFMINNGYDLIATVTLDFLPPLKGSRHCLATVRVNNTLAMSGEQMSDEPPSDASSSFLYLGSIPPDKAAELSHIDGFMGCMRNLNIDLQPVNILKDAVDSNDIKECVSLACLSNPCSNGAKCLDRNSTWTCLCPSGYLGIQCEKSVCENNPCLFGGSCVIFPGSGFICLCPLGKHGQFCEFDLDIGQPMYSSTVAGLSSFSAHPLPADIHQSMFLSFKFIPHDMEQISLMLFLGQDGQHGPGSDHLAVSFIKGFIVLTWNLGSGPRRIFTHKPIEDLGHRPHAVQIGRDGQEAWLFVDNLGNVTGKSPGSLTQLNTRSVLYLGGHDSTNFSLLPHDLPLHTGFSGCLYDARLQTGHIMIVLQHAQAMKGRSVGQCGTTLCHEHACQNGAGCIHHGATFTCLCADGWFGPTCGQPFNPCEATQHHCRSGSTCVPTKNGYSCDCPLGYTGQFCETEENLSDVRFSGIRSYLLVAAEGLQQHRSCIDLEIMPTSNHGLLMFSSLSDGQNFFSLSLHGGVLELRVSAGKHRRRGEPLVIRSRRLVALGRWHRIRAARYGRRLFLWVEGTVNSAMLLPGETISSNSHLYIGGIPDLSMLPVGATPSHATFFEGCVRRLALQWKWHRLNSSTIVNARNIADCDKTSCGGDVCGNGGTCYLDEGVPRCQCLPEYVGEHCDKQVSCTLIGCKHGGRCVEEKAFSRCSCPMGKGGTFCEVDTSFEAPYFGGESYMVINRLAAATPQQNALINMAVDFVYINFTTAASDGMLLWTARAGADEYLGIGVEDGLLKVVWAWEDEKPVVVMVPGGAVSDGAWHDLAVSLDTKNVSVWADHREVAPPRGMVGRPLATDGRFYLGGFPDDVSVFYATQGHFSTGFQGCLQKLAWSLESVVSNFSSFPGKNIGACDPFEK